MVCLELIINPKTNFVVLTAIWSGQMRRSALKIIFGLIVSKKPDLLSTIIPCVRIEV